MIYILAPANVYTGGPELLHQLGYKLRLLGFEACICYYNRTDGICPLGDSFKKYEVPYVDNIDNSKGNYIVFPEEKIDAIPLVCGEAVPILWWLSVDNARINDSRESIIRNNASIIHLCQSQYAADYLTNVLGIKDQKIMYLSDYINSIFLNLDNNDNRENIVAVNPSKGWEFTQDLIRRSDGRVSWRIINGLTPEGVRTVLQNSKVYIDFGNHPGKDRIPREAALCGACVITSKAGAAKNDIDISIPMEYKYDENEDKQIILDKIYEVLDQYSRSKEKFRLYVGRTKREFIEFEKDVYECFGALLDIKQEEISQEELLNRILDSVQEGKYHDAYIDLVGYRVGDYEEGLIISILESYIRIGIGEYHEAEFIAKEAIKLFGESAELYTLAARAVALSAVSEAKLKESLHFCSMATKLSEGTDEYNDITACVKEVIGLVKEKLRG